jgi:cytochrome c biogenesis protein CcmG, thiol:disulfide interchange protein DsbE
MRRSLLPAALLAFVVAGCTGGSGHGGDRGPTPPPGPDHQRLVAAADLDPCPHSGGAAASGGLPDVTLPCLGAGPAVRMASLRGPLVVNIWGSWCGPCQQETPYLASVYQQLRGRVRFLGVDDEDDPDSALDFAAHVRPRMRYPSVSDDDKAVLVGLHGRVAVPMTVFVDATGRVVHVRVAAYTSAADVLADIDHYLGVAA